MVVETTDAVWMSVWRCVEPLMDPHLRELCLPRSCEAFDAKDFIRERGSLYLVAGQQQAAMAAPLLMALVDHWLTTAQEMALDCQHRRVDPVVMTVLDELTQATRCRISRHRGRYSWPWCPGPLGRTVVGRARDHIRPAGGSAAAGQHDDADRMGVG